MVSTDISIEQGGAISFQFLSQSLRRTVLIAFLGCYELGPSKIPFL